jgi:lipopolysaccharide/colanic/teichoic acid biosynthesis glycosyltransferase
MSSFFQLEARRTPANPWIESGMELAERISAAFLVALISPLLVLIWSVTLALSGRTPLIAHRRVGQGGSELWVFKFRTMWQGPRKFVFAPLWLEYIDDENGPALKGPDDDRVSSRFARFCRRHSLDELPQLVQVVLGQMSLVGPRPVTASELDRIYGSTADEIVQCRPGISGLWQVSGRGRLSLAQRCRLDLELVRRRSLKLYLQLVMKTFREIIVGDGAW